MGDLTITLRVNQDGSVALLDKTSEKLKDMGRSGQEADKHIQFLGKNLMDIKAGADVVFGAVKQVADFTGELLKAGEASRSMKESLDDMTRGNSVRYLDSMRASTKELIPDLNLGMVATKALGLGFIDSEQSAAQLARTGAILGKRFGGDMVAGINTLTDVMKGADKAMMLDNIGISVGKVKTRYEELRKSMSDDKAWAAAVLEAASTKAKALEGALDGAGTGVKRLENAFDSLKTHAGENLSYLLDQTIKLLEAMGEVEARRVKTAADKQSAQPYGPLINSNSGQYITGNNTILNREMVRGKTLGQIFNGDVNTTGISPVDYYRMMAGDNYGSLVNIPGRNFTTNTPGGGGGGGGSMGVDLATYEQNLMRIEELKRRANRDAGYTGHKETMGDLYAQQAMSRFNIADEFNKSAQAADLLNRLISGGEKLLTPYADTVGGISKLWDEVGKSAERARSKAAAFGLGDGGIYGETGGNLGDLASQRRAEVEKELNRKYGKGSKKATEGLATFDASTKSAIDGYRVATGQATATSIAFEDKLGDIQKRFLSGKIDMATYTKSLYDLNTAAIHAKGNFAEFFALTMPAHDNTGSAKNPYLGAGNSRKEYRDATKPGDKDKNVSPFGELKEGLDDVSDKMTKIKTDAGTLPTSFGAAIPDAVKQVQPLTKEFEKIEALLRKSLAFKAGVKITIQTTGSATVGGGGGGPGGITPK